MNYHPHQTIDQSYVFDKCPTFSIHCEQNQTSFRMKIGTQLCTYVFQAKIKLKYDTSVQVQQQKQTSLLGQSPGNLWTCFKFANFFLSRTPGDSWVVLALQSGIYLSVWPTNTRLCIFFVAMYLYHSFVYWFESLNVSLIHPSKYWSK